MSKRELKKYLNELDENQLREQVEDLYSRFKDVKEYYDFVFNPQENKLLENAKLKISKEYFPINTRKPKARRSVAQKLIKNFITLGVDVSVVAELMLYNLEIAQVFSSQKEIKQDAFYKSMLTSFNQLVDYLENNGYEEYFYDRIEAVALETREQQWFNAKAFEKKATTLKTNNKI